MQSAIHVPNFGEYADPRFTAGLARDAEAAGWDGFFVWDHINAAYQPGTPMSDPWVLLTALALATERVRIGTMVTPLPRRRPWKLARETVTVDRGGDRVRVVTVKDGEQQAREFDRLVLGIPPSAALEFLDASPAEKELYGDGTILFNHYVVATATVEKFPWWVVNTLQPGRDDSGAYPPPVGHPYIFGKQWKQSDLTLYYAPIEGDLTEDQIRARMEADSRLSTKDAPDARFGEWKNYADWPRYFPRVSLDDMSSFRGGAGWYDQVEALQGQNNTYLCTASCRSSWSNWSCDTPVTWSTSVSSRTRMSVASAPQ